MARLYARDTEQPQTAWTRQAVPAFIPVLVSPRFVIEIQSVVAISVRDKGNSSAHGCAATAALWERYRTPGVPVRLFTGFA
jgi:hypothetical protein